ncbi:hypothetical protein JHK86_043072 [Glycine max]|nr:hypothetical protein JHK86_043072 [Glycine max]
MLGSDICKNDATTIILPILVVTFHFHFLLCFVFVCMYSLYLAAISLFKFF